MEKQKTIIEYATEIFDALAVILVTPLTEEERRCAYEQANASAKKCREALENEKCIIEKIHNLTIMEHSVRMRQIHKICDEALGHER